MAKSENVKKSLVDVTTQPNFGSKPALRPPVAQVAAARAVTWMMDGANKSSPAAPTLVTSVVTVATWRSVQACAMQRLERSKVPRLRYKLRNVACN
jgi:hypothetical protein